jgi:FKBP-type peptidyl-prolyl cis-trans isomerase
MKKILLFIPILLLFGCGGEAQEELAYDESEYDVKITEYMEKNGLEGERQTSGLWIVYDEVGSEEKPTLDSYMTMNYEGYLLDGTWFDGTKGDPLEFGNPLDYTIAGWREGIPKFGRGGKGTLLIPPDLGYGAEDMGPIPGNSILVFDIEVIDFAMNPPPPPDFSEEIINYMELNDLDTADAIVTPSGLYILIDKEGESKKPTVHDYVTIFYKGTLTNGTQFDATAADPATFLLADLIEGWKEGIPYIGAGGKCKLIIPPYLGYGPREQPNIPGNSVLIFDIELLEFSAVPPEN